MKKWLISSLILFATLSGVLLIGSSVSAFSPYDTFRVTSDTTIMDPGCSTMDIGTSWFSDMVTYFEGTNPTLADDLVTTWTNPDTHYWSLGANEQAGGYRLLQFQSYKKTWAFDATVGELNTPIDGSDAYQNSGYAVRTADASPDSTEYLNVLIYFSAPDDCEVQAGSFGPTTWPIGTTVNDGIVGTSGNFLFTGLYLESLRAGSASYSGMYQYLIFSTIPWVVPDGYEGETPPPTIDPTAEPETIYPQYDWSVTKNEDGTGSLKVKYLDNLPHFLTGISYIVVEEFDEDWGEITGTIDSDDYTPGGWAEWDVEIPSGEGWYMFRIDHNQQLDSPPWESNAEDLYIIGQVYYQFYWDGNKALNGTTIGCDGIVCNDIKNPDKLANQVFYNLNIETFGLSSIITAPLVFFQNLPENLENCTPLNLPFPNNTDFEIPCMTPYYTENLGTYFTIYQTIMVGGFTYFASLNLFHRIKQISNPKNDQIEVVQL